MGGPGVVPCPGVDTRSGSGYGRPMTTTPHPADPAADTMRAMIGGTDDYAVVIPDGAGMNAYDHLPAGIMGGSPWVDVIDYPTAGTVTRATLDALSSDVGPVYPIVPVGRYRAAMSAADVPDDIRADVTPTADGDPIVFGWVEVDDDGAGFTADTRHAVDGEDLRYVGADDIVRAMTTTPPRFIPTHDTHTIADVVGHDIVRSVTPIDGPVRLTVVDVITDPTRYGDAVAIARTARAPRPDDGGRSWAYASCRYRCGCRWVATALTGVGRNPAPVFIDHPHA